MFPEWARHETGCVAVRSVFFPLLPVLGEMNVRWMVPIERLSTRGVGLSISVGVATPVAGADVLVDRPDTGRSFTR